MLKFFAWEYDKSTVDFLYKNQCKNFQKIFFFTYRKDSHYSTTIRIRPSLPARHFGIFFCRIRTLWGFDTRIFENLRIRVFRSFLTIPGKFLEISNITLAVGTNSFANVDYNLEWNEVITSQSFSEIAIMTQSLILELIGRYLIIQKQDPRNQTNQSSAFFYMNRP